MWAGMTWKYFVNICNMSLIEWVDIKSHTNINILMKSKDNDYLFILLNQKYIVSLNEISEPKIPCGN